MKESRIYVCHTLYHVLISLIKELALYDNEEKGKAHIALSTVYMDFTPIKERLKEAGVFSEVLTLNEKYFQDIPELVKYKTSYNNIVKHLFNRIVFTKKFGKAQDKYIDIDFKNYKDIYVYCDSDPIGYYLNYHHIKYHAMEDGLDCLKNFDAAHFDNAGHFKLKAFLASMNLIFIQNGYSKYCIDMEINDDSYLDYKFRKYKVLPRKPLEDKLSASDKQRIANVFIENAMELKEKIKAFDNCILFLTEGYPGDNKEVRIKVSYEILKDYCGIDIDVTREKIKNGESLAELNIPKVLIKPHPRDDVDYEKLYPMCSVIQGKFPIEILNYIEGIHFTKTISIITSALDGIDFADEKINIGPHIYDKYEPVEKHRFMLEAWDKNNSKK